MTVIEWKQLIDRICIIENSNFTEIIFLTKSAEEKYASSFIFYFLGHCVYKPGERSICVSLGERHDR